MRNVVSFSGGRTSAYMCYLAKHGMIEDPVFIFMDTGAEHPATYSFVKRCNEYFELNLVYLKAKINPKHGIGVTYEVVDDIGYDLGNFARLYAKTNRVPSYKTAICTDRLKATTSRKYCQEVFGKGGYVTWIGIRADEPRRLKFIEKTEDLFGDVEVKPVRYLAEISDFDKQDILNWWKDQPFDLEIPEHLGNCVFCVKKNVNKLALAAKQEPEMAREWIALQENVSPDRRQPQYRGLLNLENIIENFKDITEEQLEQKIYRGQGVIDIGECSESCEVFSSENLELFND